MTEEEKEFAEKIGARGSQLRKERKMTQLQFGGICGINRSSISDIENSKCSLMLSTLIKICEGLNITMSEFLKDFDE